MNFYEIDKMKRIKLLLIGVVVLIFILLVHFIILSDENNVSEKIDLSNKVCSQDNDCVKASCCHATDVVNRDNAPDCSGVMCTQVCEPGTLDCGQGQKKCLEGICTAILE